MEKAKLIELLESFIRKAILEKNAFKSELSEPDKQIIVKSFQDNVLSFLDYIYTNFPTERNNLGDYFPRPLRRESEDLYKDRIKSVSKKGRKIDHPKKIIHFLEKFFKINARYMDAVSYIESKAKHETPYQFNEIVKNTIIANIQSSPRNPLIASDDGSVVEIPGFRFENCQNVTISNSIAVSDNEVTTINYFFLNQEKDIGNKVLLADGIDLDFFEWTNNCVSILQETLLIFSKDY